MSLLVWIEQVDGRALASCWEVLGKGRALADELGLPLAALVMGDAPAPVAAIAHEAASYGADIVYTVTNPLLAHYRLSAYAAGLHEAIRAVEATVVLTSASVKGREVAAATACDLNAGFAPDVVDLRVEDDQLVAVRSIYSNNLLTDVRFHAPLQVASVRPRAFPMPQAGSADDALIEPLELVLDEADLPESVLASERLSSGNEISLTDASIVVSGGRGVAADPVKGFALVSELADVLGAAVGASRAAVDAGYIPYKHQVGQTGKTVKPDLYIAVGISGAIQHLAGMGSSKTIVAINQSRNAAIFERAHYGVVGDLYELLPALTAEFKRRLGK